MAESNSPGSFQSPPAPPHPMVIDGANHDLALASCEFFTRREVLERRSRRVKQLCRVYRELYWALMEELKRKYREYYWTYGKSPFKEDEKEAEGIGDYPEGIGENGKLGLGSVTGSDEIRRCDVTGCKAKAMALTKYCHAHILSDKKQRLYKGCTFVIKSMQSGPLLCSKPVLRSTVPCYCPGHLQKGEKCLARDLRKAGLNVSSTSKLRPDFHVLVAECVRQIQVKRRAARKATAVKIESN
ncbi:INO80 complex subunit D, partial [Cucurbita argyrosperma subsp. argyrosperma]|uniref:INO80 complex subunit D-like n=3 Tax=Cucurbita TaxID=3660 RepID=A0A6J1JMD6_CUCMA